MTARTFGRKSAIGEAGQRRAALVAHQPRSFEPAGRETDVLADGRAEAELKELRPPVAERLMDALRRLPPRRGRGIPAGRSLKLAWPIWFVTGLFGGLRFYLGRVVTGAMQFLLFFGCVGAVAFAQRYEAFAGLALSWAWMLFDGIRLKAWFAPTGEAK